MSRRFVVLATDAAAPSYAVWAPVAARVWRLCGWEPLLLCHAEHWDTTLWGREIRRELDVVAATMLDVVTCPPMGVPNTMRCSRLAAAAWSVLRDDDVLLTSDVDIIPVDKTFFHAPPSEAFSLRSHYQAWLALSDRSFLASEIEPGNFRLAMCYCGATAACWRRLFPEIEVGDVNKSIARIFTGRGDSTDNDEVVLSFRFLSGWPGPTVEECPGQWRRGELLLTDPVHAPNLYCGPAIPRGLAIHGAGGCGRGTPALGCIDWIPGRFEAGSRPWSDVHAVGLLHPELKEWVTGYLHRMKELL